MFTSGMKLILTIRHVDFDVVDDDVERWLQMKNSSGFFDYEGEELMEATTTMPFDVRRFSSIQSRENQ
jgi:hypothetical protein